MKQRRLIMAGISAIFLLVTVLLSVDNSRASQTRFVRPSVEVPVRRGQGREFKILKLVKDGDRVELLQEADSWAKVRIGNKTEGWMPKRFLSTEAPPVKRVQILLKENRQLKEKNKQLGQQLDELQGVQTTTGGELAACIQERDTIRGEYQTLRADTADVIAVKTAMETTQKNMKKLQHQLQVVQQENDNLKRKTALSWFLAGGGVLFIGWIIGLITCRSKRRRPALM